MGARDARRLRVLGQGVALCDQPARAGRSGDFVKRFLNSGVTELGDRLGPLLWQFAPTKKFDAADFGSSSSCCRASSTAAAASRRRGAARQFLRAGFRRADARVRDAVVFAEHETYPAIADITGDFVYARLQKGKDEMKTGYPPKELDAWAKRFGVGRRGAPEDLPLVDKKSRRRSRATCSPMSSTRARCARRPPRWS